MNAVTRSEKPKQLALDDRINAVLDRWNAAVVKDTKLPRVFLNPIHHWGFHGCPGPFSSRGLALWEADLEVLSLIADASEEEIKASKSDYVRGAWGWLKFYSPIVSQFLAEHYQFTQASRSARSVEELRALLPGQNPALPSEKTLTEL